MTCRLQTGRPTPSILRPETAPVVPTPRLTLGDVLAGGVGIAVGWGAMYLVFAMLADWRMGR